MSSWNCCARAPHIVKYNCHGQAYKLFDCWMSVCLQTVWLLYDGYIMDDVINTSVIGRCPESLEYMVASWGSLSVACAHDSVCTTCWCGCELCVCVSEHVASLTSDISASHSHTDQWERLIFCDYHPGILLYQHEDQYYVSDWSGISRAVTRPSHPGRGNGMCALQVLTVREIDVWEFTYAYANK
jgi:hypothetical protein